MHQSPPTNFNNNYNNNNNTTTNNIINNNNNSNNNILTLQQQQEQLQQIQIKRKEEFNEALTTCFSLIESSHQDYRIVKVGVQSITELTTSSFCTNSIKIKILKTLLDMINTPLIYSKTVIRYSIKGIGVIGCQDESLVTQTITFLAKILEFKSENYHYMKKVCFHALSRIGRKFPVYQNILLSLFEKYFMSPLSTNDVICSILLAFSRLSQTNSQIRAMSVKRWLEAIESPHFHLKSAGILSLGYASCPTGNIINDKDIESICYSKSIELLQFHKIDEVIEDEKNDPWRMESVYQVQISACKALGLLARSSTTEWLPKISKIFKTILSSNRYASPVKATVLLNYGQISYYLSPTSPFYAPLKTLLFELSSDENTSVSSPSCQSLTKFALSHDSNYNEVKEIIKSKIGPSLKQCKQDQTESFLKTWCKLISRNYRPILNQCSSIISPLFGDLYDPKSPLSNQLVLFKNRQLPQQPLSSGLLPLLMVPGGVSYFSDAFNDYQQLSNLVKYFSANVIQSCLIFFKKPSLLDHPQFKKALKDKIIQQRSKGFQFLVPDSNYDELLKELSSDALKRETFLTLISHPENLDNTTWINKFKQHIIPTSKDDTTGSPTSSISSPKPSPTITKLVDPRLEKKNVFKALPLISQQQPPQPPSPTVQTTTLPTTTTTTTTSTPTPSYTFKKSGVFNKPSGGGQSSSISATLAAASALIKPSVNNSSISATLAAAASILATSTQPTTTTTEEEEKKKNIFTPLPLIGQQPSPKPVVNNNYSITATLAAASTNNGSSNSSTTTSPIPISTTITPPTTSPTTTTTTLVEKKKNPFTPLPLINQTNQTSLSTPTTTTTTTTTIGNQAPPPISSVNNTNNNNNTTPPIPTPATEKKKNPFAPLPLIGQTSPTTTTATISSPSSSPTVKATNNTTSQIPTPAIPTPVSEKKKNPFAPLPLIGQQQPPTSTTIPINKAVAKPSPHQNNLFSKPLPLIGQKPQTGIPSNQPIKKPSADIYKLPPTVNIVKKPTTTKQNLGLKLMAQTTPLPVAKKPPANNIFKPLPLIGQTTTSSSTTPTPNTTTTTTTTSPTTVKDSISVNNNTTPTTVVENKKNPFAPLPLIGQLSTTPSSTNTTTTTVSPLAKIESIDVKTKEAEEVKQNNQSSIEDEQQQTKDSSSEFEEDIDEDGEEEEDDDDEEEDDDELMIDDNQITSFDNNTTTTSSNISKKRTSTLLDSDSEDEEDSNKKVKLEKGEPSSSTTSTSTKVSKKKKKKSKKQKKPEEKNKNKNNNNIKNSNSNDNKKNNNNSNKNSNQVAGVTVSIETSSLYQGIEKKSGKPEPIICSFYKIGTCKKGADCTFLHEGPVEIRKPTEVCKYFKTSSCAKGDACTYSHDLTMEPCKFFNSPTGCNNQDCPYGHRLFTPSTSSPTLTNSQLQTPTTTTNTSPINLSNVNSPILTDDNSNKPFLSFGMDNQYLFQTTSNPPQHQQQQEPY